MKPTRFVAGTLIAVAVLSGCSSEPSPREVAQQAGMSKAASFACEDFLSGYSTISNESKQARADLARKTNEWAQKAGGAYKDAGDALARTADGSAKAWQTSADWFAGVCIQNGWPAKE